VVTWSDNGQGTCRVVGKVARYVRSASHADLMVGNLSDFARYFNVHDELLN